MSCRSRPLWMLPLFAAACTSAAPIAGKSPSVVTSVRFTTTITGVPQTTIAVSPPTTVVMVLEGVPGAPTELLSVGPKATVDVPAGAIRVNVGDDLAALADGSPENSVFLISAGVHRDQFNIRPRTGQRFVGEPGAVLNGSHVLTGFVPADGHWVLRGQKLTSASNGQCQKGHPLCSFSDDVFRDDVPLKPVASKNDLVPGTWYANRDHGEIWIGEDPSGFTLEQSVADTNAFNADVGRGGNRVEIRNLVIEKYGTPAQSCAIDAQDAGGGWQSVADANSGKSGGWTVVDNVLRLNHACGAFMGPAGRMQGNRVTDNGQVGLKGAGRHVTVMRNEISGSNWAGFDESWEAGGAKFWNAADLVFSENYVHDNQGNGAWADYALTNINFERNRVVGNKGAGIAEEMTLSGRAVGNYLEGNDWGDRGNPGYIGGAIFVFDGSHFEVSGNVLRHNVGGIVVQVQERGCIGPDIKQLSGACPAGSTKASVDGVVVHDNDIEMIEGFTGLQLLPSSDFEPYAQSSPAWAKKVFDGTTVRFDHNKYSGRGYEDRNGTNGTQYDDSTARFVWGFPSGWTNDSKVIWSWSDRRYLGFDAWRRLTGQDAHGTLN